MSILPPICNSPWIGIILFVAAAGTFAAIYWMENNI